VPSDSLPALGSGTGAPRALAYYPEVLGRLTRGLGASEFVAGATSRREDFRRSVLLGVLIGTPLSALFLWLAVRGIDWKVVWHAIKSVSLPWVLGIAVGFTGTYAFFTLRWSILVNAIGPVPRRRVAAYVLSGAALSNVLPGRPGEFARGYWAARSAGTNTLTGMGTVVVDRAFDVLFLALTLIAVTPFVHRPDWLRVLLGFSVAAAVGLGAILIIASRRIHRQEPAVESSKAVAGLRARLSAARESFVRGLATIHTKRDAATLILFTIGAWTSWALAAWCCTRAVGISIGILGLVFLTTVVNLGVSIPSTAGFVGTYQWLCVSALSVFSVARSNAFAFAVVLHGMSLIPVTLVGYGVLCWLAVRQRARGARWPAVQPNAETLTPSSASRVRDRS
jgi:glycosyltransferase 2 family protein